MHKGASTVPRLAVSTAAVVSILWCAGAIARAADWPQFRGPTGQGHAPDAAVPLEWSETENVTWKAPVEGRGWSSPVIAGGRIWLTTAVTDPADGSSLRLLAYDV
ncbi:MAG: serine/threonine protein kinase, partial [Acidobacteriota bacterium]|nr:serine/threonine protein kinase [Acidobacteriota bacterium]